MCVGQITGDLVNNLKWVILGEFGLGPSIGESPLDQGISETLIWFAKKVAEKRDSLS